LLWEVLPPGPLAQAAREAARAVYPLFLRGLSREEVLASLRGARLEAQARERAIELASEYEDVHQTLEGASWAVVRAAGAPEAAYHQALRRAEAAYRLAPGQGDYLTTLGVALYRLGRHKEAATVLTRAAR